MKPFLKYNSKSIIIIAFLVLSNSCTSAIVSQKILYRKIVKESTLKERSRLINKLYADSLEISFGIINPTKSPYNIDNTGRTDVTDVLQQALNDARDSKSILYLPSGKYLVSKTIEGIIGIVEWDQWQYGDPLISNPYFAEASFEYPNVIWGSTLNEGVTIKLADNSEGFQNENSPKPVLYFWARVWRGLFGDKDLDKPTSAINFNQRIMNINIDLGQGNPGAIGIDLQGAEGSSIENVKIRAYDSFCGIRNIPGSGGSIHGIEVYGGKFGILIERSQPSPLISDFKLIDQELYSVFSKSYGPLTLVGGYIVGKGIYCSKSLKHFSGALNLIDVAMQLNDADYAVESSKSIFIDNLICSGVDSIINVANENVVVSDKNKWTKIKNYVAGTTYELNWKDEIYLKRDSIYINNYSSSIVVIDTTIYSTKPSLDFLEMHRSPILKDFYEEKVCNVKLTPYNAKGDGKTDDWIAIQKALNENDVVFIPKGNYLITRPLSLNSRNTLFGISNLNSVITAPNVLLKSEEDEFTNVNKPQPLIYTNDDEDSFSNLSMLRLIVPSLNPSIYALLWRAGSKSIVNSVYIHQSFWHPSASVKNYPLVKINSNGGGRWYNLQNYDYWNQGPDHRFIKVESTIAPLRFYHLQPQFIRSDAMIEFKNSKNIYVYSTKSEGDFPVYFIKDCENVNLYGLSGFIIPFADKAIIEIIDTDRITITNLNPFLNQNFGVNWGDFISFDPAKAYSIRNEKMKINCMDQLVYFFLENN